MLPARAIGQIKVLPQAGLSSRLTDRHQTGIRQAQVGLFGVRWCGAGGGATDLGRIYAGSMAIRIGSVIVSAAVAGGAAFTSHSIRKSPLRSLALFSSASTSKKSVAIMAPSVAHFIDSTNAQYEVLHKNFELQFWGTKSELLASTSRSP